LHRPGKAEVEAEVEHRHAPPKSNGRFATAYRRPADRQRLPNAGGSTFPRRSNSKHARRQDRLRIKLRRTASAPGETATPTGNARNNKTHRPPKPQVTAGKHHNTKILARFRLVHSAAPPIYPPIIPIFHTIFIFVALKIS